MVIPLYNLGKGERIEWKNSKGTNRLSAFKKTYGKVMVNSSKNAGGTNQ